MIKKVKCDVETCQHNECKLCNLETLDISCTCNGKECHHEKETICHSFSKRNEI